MRRQEKKVGSLVRYFFTIYMSYSQLKMRRTDTTMSHSYTAKTLYRKFETNITRNDTARLRSQFLRLCIFEQFIYSHDGSAYFAYRGII
jgi:hypothetical protein